ncbi:hypothetical protein NEMIN01_1034 [Nematocida minor]|uniref:uncharacterized protein n=1 Tax=Nematocida minor TaxID=1912983 RepID=UPI002220D8F8|nr:uncharacterized protein NEMIN01_1034 [Nematocida minor]KAI5190410.1 hypothetical protein NEMIN01_1034 [Nematocida minor]
MKYKESMPLTSISRTGKNFLLGGGGGNPIFGFPNRIVMLDAELNVLAEANVKEVVVSSKVYSDEYVLVEYPSSYELFILSEGDIQGPYTLPFGVYSPIIVKGTLYYIKEGKVFKIEVSKIKNSKTAESEIKIKTKEITSNKGHADTMNSQSSPDNITTQDADSSTSHDTSDQQHEAASASDLSSWEKAVDINEEIKMSSLYTNGQSLLYKATKKNIPFLFMEEGREVMLDGPISSYSASKSLGYIVQLPKDKSVLTMMHRDQIWTVIEPMCITIHSTEDGVFYVGTGTGHVIAYKKGRELWRKKVFTSPVSGIASMSGQLYCTCINGRVAKVATEGAMKQVVKMGLFIVCLSACVGAAKYYAEERMRSIFEAARSYFIK